MKKYLLYIFIVLFIVSISSFLIYQGNETSDFHNPDITVLDEIQPKEFESAATEKTAKSKKFMSERKKRMKGIKKRENPDLFAEYHAGIRTREGETSPSYPMNYKIRELLEARNVNSTEKLAKLQTRAALNWQERGPGNVSGRTRGILVDPADPNYDTWYAGSVSGGVWKTEDAGQTWTHLTENLTNLATSTLAMSPANPDVIYAGTGEGFFNVDQVDGSGIWRSDDRGQTWQQLSSTANNLDFQNIMRMIVDPSDENTILVATAAGFYHLGSRPSSKIFRSTDGGQNWTQVYDAGQNNIEHLIANPENFDTQYATINSVGVIKSKDGGLTWQDASQGIGPVARMEIAIAPTDTSAIYISAQGGETGSILYVSDDGANTWLSAKDANGNDVHWLAGQGWYDNTIAVNPYDKNRVFVGGVNLWRLDLQSGVDTSDAQVTGVDENNTESFLSFVNWGGPYAGGGIGTGDDFLGSFGVDSTDFVSVEIRFGSGRSQMAHRFLRDAGTGNYLYQDYVEVPFEVWDVTNNIQLMVSFRDWADNGVFDLIEFDSNNLQREYLFVNAIPYDAANPDANVSQTNGMVVENIYGIWPILTFGGTWDPDNLPLSNLRINWGRFVQKLLVTNNITDGYGQFGGSTKGVHVDHHNILLIPTNEATNSFRLVNGNDGGVSFSDDGGQTFDQPLNGYNTTQFYGVDKMNGADRYIGGTQDNGTWLSPVDADASSSWTPAPSGDGFEAVWHYDDPNKILESSQFNRVYRSLDGGSSWELIGPAQGLDDVGGGAAPFFTKLAKSKQDPELVFAVGESGVWRTDNFGSQWTLTPMSNGWNGTSSFSEVKISLVNPQIVWTGRNMLDSSPVYVSTDGGLTFNATTVYPDVTLGRVTGIETHPIEDSTAFALFSFANAPKILKTTDLGQTWTDISGFGTNSTSSNGFPDVAVFSLLVMPYNTDIIWAGTEIGIFESTDGGASWAYADNGFPSAAVYEMLIVNDEVVVGTHGRGVWSVALPELAGYEPPPATLSPRINDLAQSPNGYLNIDMSLRSTYDSTWVMIDDQKMMTVFNNQPTDTVTQYAVTTNQTIDIQLQSFKDGNTFKSPMFTKEVFSLASPQVTYLNDLDETTTDFEGDGFTQDTPSGFSNAAFHTTHPYSNNLDISLLLTIPIEVANNNSIFEYDDVAIIEPGDAGSVFGDFQFWDYVVVEGTSNGIDWLPLADGYDARYDQDWEDAYNSGSDGDSTMYRTHSIDLLNTFSAGDTILIRFRLFADGFVNTWGWAIDNIRIQENATAIARSERVPSVFALSQNYPNPFNPTTTIPFAIPKASKVEIKVYDALGREVTTLFNRQVSPGYYQITWDASEVASGVYFYRILAGDYVKTRKLMLLK